MKIINKTYNVKGTMNKKIVLISDIHFLNIEDTKKLICVLDNIKKINPDYICIPGDIIDRSKVYDDEVLIDWLNILSKISKVIISIGNHEFYVDKPKKKFELNNAFFNEISNIDNLYLLDNKNTIIDDINFIGITLPMKYYDEKNKDNSFFDCIKKLKKDRYYNILLCHSPLNIYNYILENECVDLILCGHTHGGAVPTFLRFMFRNNGLISPNKKLFPKKVYGNLRVNNSNIIVTSGLKVIPHDLFSKIFKPEIVTIKIENN